MVPDGSMNNNDLPFHEGYNDPKDIDGDEFLPDGYMPNAAAKATAAAAAATKAAESVYMAKSPVKASKFARRARKYADRARGIAIKVTRIIKGRRRTNAKLVANASERRRIQEEDAARAAAVERSRQEAEEQREARRQANIAAREAERAAELAREEAERAAQDVERFKREVNNMKQQYQRGELKKQKLYLKIHPNKTRQIRAKAAPNNTYFNNLNEFVKTL